MVFPFYSQLAAYDKMTFSFSWFLQLSSVKEETRHFGRPQEACGDALLKKKQHPIQTESCIFRSVLVKRMGEPDQSRRKSRPGGKLWSNYKHIHSLPQINHWTKAICMRLLKLRHHNWCPNVKGYIIHIPLGTLENVKINLLFTL